ncbi:MAG TPA: WecB/TagA/CpsF family glycosyltransferase [Chthoniobacterales bacterium]|nr:WecB/TagA/CpsF family glycosyltransferase [Chthoniobacterales bacterium]
MPRSPHHPTEQILGIPFFNGTAADAVTTMSDQGGLLVAPSGTCFERFLEDSDYRCAIVSADVALPDSGAMAVLWTVRTGRALHRISGLAYVKELLRQVDLRDVFWVLPHARAQAQLLAWCAERGAEGNDSIAAAGHSPLPMAPSSCYLAPIYGQTVRDEKLLTLIATQQPRHVVIAIGAGAQEKLGFYLREHAGGRPAIHCIGGALGFVTGDQVAIPDWADRFYLGWFLRFLSQPRVFLPRLWKARILPFLIFRHRDRLPPMVGD